MQIKGTITYVVTDEDGSMADGAQTFEMTLDRIDAGWAIQSPIWDKPKRAYSMAYALGLLIQYVVRKKSRHVAYDLDVGPSYEPEEEKNDG